MSKRDAAAKILRALGVPAAQQNERSCLTLLALGGLSEGTPWSQTSRPLMRILDIMSWMKRKYRKEYAANSRETIRRQTIHQFEQARLIDKNPDDPGRPTNSGVTRYQLTEEVAQILREFGNREFDLKCRQFLDRHGSLADDYLKSRSLHTVPVTMADGNKLELSPGNHNRLQKAIVEVFAPRFAPSAVVLYLGDTANKRLLVDTGSLDSLRVPAMKHDKLPDVVLYSKARDWLYLVEAVTTHGPISPKRHKELEAMLRKCPAGRVYVSAFPDFATFKKYASELAWESEVWIADAPDHLIHFDGTRFPRALSAT